MAKMIGVGRGNNPASRANLSVRTKGAPGLRGAGRPKGPLRRIKDICAEEGIPTPGDDEIMETYRALMWLPEGVLKSRIIQDNTRPMIERVIGKEILGKRGAEMIEKIVDRLCGRPRQATDITTNGKDIKDSRIEVEIIDSRSQVAEPDN